LKKLTADEAATVRRKLIRIGHRPLHEFKTGKARPRKWKGALPFAEPSGLSEDVRDQLPDYFDIDKKLRVWGYLTGRDFLVIGVTRQHEHHK